MSLHWLSKRLWFYKNTKIGITRLVHLHCTNILVENHTVSHRMSKTHSYGHKPKYLHTGSQWQALFVFCYNFLIICRRHKCSTSFLTFFKRLIWMCHCKTCKMTIHKDTHLLLNVWRGLISRLSDHKEGLKYLRPSTHQWNKSKWAPIGLHNLDCKGYIRKRVTLLTFEKTLIL